MTGVLSVSFNVTFKGFGIVNYNTPTKHAGIDHMSAKKIRVDEEGVYKPYTSRNCILHEVLAEPPGFKLLSQSPLAQDRLRVNLSKYRLLRGNLDATEGHTVKRKSSFCMTDALPTKKCDSIFTEYIAKGNMGGGCTRDHVGNTHFSSFVSINLDALQFISTDAQLNSAAIDGEVFDVTARSYLENKAIWDENYPNTAMPTVKYFNRVDRENRICSEYSTQGVKLADKDVARLVLWFMTNFKKFSLKKNDSYLEFESFENITVHTASGKQFFASFEDLSAFLGSDAFSVASSYVETDTPVSCEHIFEHIEASKAASKEKKRGKADKDAKEGEEK